MRHVIAVRWPLMLAGLAVFGALVCAQWVGAETKRETKLDGAAIERKLNEILSNQTVILQRLDALMEELQIVKVRATR